MREGIFILVVVLILLALTAVRYRKQISGVIGVARMLKDAKDQAHVAVNSKQPQPSVQLVNCGKCGVWVPEGKAVARHGIKYCSAACAAAT